VASSPRSSSLSSQGDRNDAANAVVAHQGTVAYSDHRAASQLAVDFDTEELADHNSRPTTVPLVRAMLELVDIAAWGRDFAARHGMFATADFRGVGCRNAETLKWHQRSNMAI